MPIALRRLSGRDIRLDVLRGLCLVIITIDHLPANWMSRIVYEFLGFVSALGGFVLISGITCGMVYGPVKDRRARIWSRCRTLYVWNIGVCALLWGAAWAFPEHTAQQWEPLLGEFYTRPVLMITASAALLHWTARIGILAMYILFLIPTPWILQLLQGRHAHRVLWGSVLIWMVDQFVVLWPPLGPGWLFNGFRLASWQVLFVAGLWIGLQIEKGDTLPLMSSKNALLACSFAAFVLFVLKHQGGLLPSVPRVLAFDSWPVSNLHLGVIRLINYAVIALLIGRIPSGRYEALRARWSVAGHAMGALEFLGKHSLPVFGFHVLGAFAACLLVPELYLTPRAVQTAVVAVSVGALFLPAWIHQILQRGSESATKASA